MSGQNDLKRKLRRLKRLELRLRFGGNPPRADLLLWSRFFSDRPGETKCKYPFNGLLDSHLRRLAFEDYITALYYQYFRERGMLEGMSDPLALAELGLPPDASLQEIKTRFRTLAKKYHPDVGGNHNQMVELIKQYHKLMGEEK